jgi:beta-glucosidase
MGWETYPQGLSDLLIGLHKEYKEYGLPPIYITENGFAWADKLDDATVSDPMRIDFLSRHLAALAFAIQQGVDIRGYFYWSLMDNFEWNSGYAKRFGLIYVDYASQQRTMKESAYWYRDFIQTQKNSPSPEVSATMLHCL